MNKPGRHILFWAFFALVVLMAFVVAGNQERERREEMTYSTFIQHVQQGDVKKVTVQGVEIRGTLNNGTNFKSVGPKEQDYMLRLMAENDVVPDFEEEPEQSWLMFVVINGLPLLILVVFMLFMMRQLQVGGGKAMNFGKSKAKLLSDSGRRVTFDDVAGCDEAKEELEEIIQFLKDPRKFTRLGGRIPKGVLLMGPPGTGKTLLARAVAGEAGVPFFSISGSDFVEMFVGVGASRVRDLFEQGKKNAPCIIFIDEIDAVGRHRGAGMGGGHDEREQTLNQLLVEMDGFESNEGVIMVAATNRPDVLDPALLRPGRFDRRIVVDAPDVRGRLGILTVHTRRVPLAEDVNLEIVAKGTPGFVGADLENLVNEAALIAARFNKKRVEMDDFEAARDKVYMGPARRSRHISEEDKRRTAYHEAGHAIVAALLPRANTVHKVTIVPRGRALGVTWTFPDEGLSKTLDEFRATLAMLMGGRVAEDVIFNELSTGASNDIQKATELARSMVCRYGMSDDLGPVAWESGSEEVFLGRDFAKRTNYSQTTAVRIDDQIRTFVETGHTWARDILLANIHILHKIAQLLLEKETIDGEEFKRVVDAMDPVLPEGVGAVA
ncbi:MAG: ATP-dependent metallopeptidase FtsH/Yme1/Tma family protein [Alphaproteobacteria bacterium]|nr:ATP-dependent metallopeptidase FtsH/Yme1/Tma family protein [Alphaproteobacteria bacterium]